MIIKDTRKIEGFASAKVPQFEGRVKITLHNCKNGKNEVIEGKNIVTNAVRDILAANYLGAVDYSKLLPIWSTWFGGVLCYQNPHPTIEVGGEQVLDPDNYYPQADSVNHLVAHAGQKSIDPNHDDDLRRGNPTSAAFIYTDDSVKQVWEWGTTHGNGTISALSLTHKDTGDAGLGSNTYAFQNFNPFEKIDMLPITSAEQIRVITTETLFGQFDDNHGFYFTIGADGEYGQDSGQSLVFSTNKVTIYIKKFPFEKTGLYETWNVDNNFVDKFTITSSNITFYVNPCYYFDYENKMLWLFSNATSTSSFSGNVIKYIVIDCVNKTEYAHGTITSDTNNIAPLGYTASATYFDKRAYTMAIIKDGNYFYFPTSSGAASAYLNVTGYKKINYVSQADQTSITFNDTQGIYTQPVYGGGLLISSSLYIQNVSAQTGRVVNGNIGYTCAPALTRFINASVHAYGNPYKPSYFMEGVGGQVNYNDYPRNIFANKMLNTTLFNLPSPVQKTSSQAMTVEYTLTEVSGT